MLGIIVHVTETFSWLEALGPLLAAVAAGASWRAVFISRRSQVDADLPQFVFSIRASDPSAAPSVLTLTIENVGRGVAVFPGFLILSGDGFGVQDIIDDATFATGSRARFGLPFNTTDEAVGIVFCEDRYNNVHVWSATKKYRRYKKSKRRVLTPRKMAQDLYSRKIGDARTWVAAVPLP